MIKIGEMAYTVESSRVIRTRKILRENREVVLFGFQEGGGIWVRKNRVYSSKEAAEAAIQVKTGHSNATAARNHMAAIFR